MKTTPRSDQARALREFAEVLRGRRTIELFLQTKVPESLLKEAIATATWAPNHHVTEPWHFYLIGDIAKQHCLDLCRDIASAKKGEKAGEFKRRSWSEKPGWLVVSCRRSEDKLLQREDYAACCAAIQNFMLYLWSAGVGCKWTSGDITRESRFHDIVGLDAGEEFVVGLIWYGYPKLTPVQSRKDPLDVMTEIA